MSWQVAILVVALWALSGLLRHKSARLRYSLWMLVPLRLVLPPTLALATGWAWWVLPAQEALPLTVTPPREARSFEAPEVTLPSMREAKRVESFGPLPPQGWEAEQPVASTLPPVIAMTPIPARAWPWRTWLLAMWSLGTLFMSIRFVRGLRQVRQLVRSSTPLTDVGLNQLLDHCRQRVGVGSAVRLHESPLVETPLLIGYWRPMILVPSQIQEQLSPPEIESVLIHELHHVKRHDAVVSLFQAVLKAVYFFHPGVWLADRLLRRLREEACDEATVSLLSGQRRNYGSAILKLAEQSLRPAPPLAIGVVDSGSHITHRMRRILDPKLPTGRTLSWSALALVIAVGATLLPAGPRTEVLEHNSPEADAGIKPVEFRIVPETLPEDDKQVQWLPIRKQAAPQADKKLGLPHTREVGGRTEAAVWDVAEHCLPG